VLDYELLRTDGTAMRCSREENRDWFEATIGGLDIFKTNWEEGAWSAPQNAGTPFNSPADDLFLVWKKNGRGGYLISNRLFGTARTNTISQDIFEFLPNEKE
jgi:hypothetical protein